MGGFRAAPHGRFSGGWPHGRLSAACHMGVGFGGGGSRGGGGHPRFAADRARVRCIAGPPAGDSRAPASFGEDPRARCPGPGRAEVGAGGQDHLPSGVLVARGESLVVALRAASAGSGRLPRPRRGIVPNP